MGIGNVAGAEHLDARWRGRIVIDLYRDRLVGNLLPHGACPDRIVRKEEPLVDCECEAVAEAMVRDFLSELTGIEAKEGKAE